MKIALIIILVLVLLGGGYWYFGIYLPYQQERQYVKDLIPIYKSFQEDLSSASRGPAQNQDDIIALGKRHEEVVQVTRDKLNILKPPKKLQQIHQDFLGLLDAFIPFISFLTSGRLDQAMTDIQKEIQTRGEAFDNKFQELVKTYGI